jgi:hypothetical protein
MGEGEDAAGGLQEMEPEEKDGDKQNNNGCI